MSEELYGFSSIERLEKFIEQSGIPLEMFRECEKDASLRRERAILLSVSFKEFEGWLKDNDWNYY